jgi:hypothetical protein
MAQGEGGGRPRKELTDDQKAQIEALSAYLSQDHIADWLGISRVTLRAIMDRDPEVSERYQRGKARAHAKVAESLVKSAIGGNTSAQIFYMKTQLGWKETTHVDLTSSDGTMSPTRIEIVAGDNGTDSAT